jgi:hypothetical protein
VRWLLLALVLTASASHSQPTPKPIPPVAGKAEAPNSGKEKPGNQQSISVNLPSPVNVTVSGKLDVKTDQEKNGRHKESTNWAEWSIALFTLLLVCVTGYLVHYTKNLWGTTERVANEAKESSERQLRAYVGVSHPKLVIKSEQGKTKLLVIMEYINAGQTPAKDVALHMKAKAYDYFKPDGPKPVWDDPKNTKDEGKGGTLLPSVPWLRHSEVEGFTETLIGEMERHKTKTVWVWGTISYEDIFGYQSDVIFRFSSSDYRRDLIVPEQGGNLQGFALIPDLEYTKGNYGHRKA